MNELIKLILVCLLAYSSNLGILWLLHLIYHPFNPTANIFLLALRYCIIFIILGLFGKMFKTLFRLMLEYEESKKSPAERFMDKYGR